MTRRKNPSSQVGTKEKNNPHSAPGRIRTRVPEVENEARHHYPNLTDLFIVFINSTGSAGCYSNVQPHIKQTQDILQNAQRRLAFPDTPKILRGKYKAVEGCKYPLI